MSTIFAKRALLSTGWAFDVRLILRDGRIGQIEENTTAKAGDTLADTVVPALANLHSHSFQRAMAGMTEQRAAGQDSFWTWRTLMYQFLEHLTPDHIRAIAAQTFMEMQEAGYGAVGEFHYVHHQVGGTTYDRRAELSDQIFTAAEQSGIGLTHLPVLYTYGGAAQAPLAGGQKRFGNSVDEFAELLEQARGYDHAADTRVGIAPHSLRATCPEDLKRAITLRGDSPIHIHIAEQPKEVADISQWLGARPVEWLLNNVEVDTNWCLIHATHMTKAETIAMAQSGAVAGLCPITEANLGDGPFNGPDYIAHGGAFGIGSDSNVRITLGEELRLLEYSQRLRDLARNVMIPNEGSVGTFLFTRAAKGGAQALGRGLGCLAVGEWADITAIDSTHPTLCALRADQLLDGVIFAAPDNIVTDTWSAGRHMVQNGRHVARDAISSAYRAAVQDLVGHL